MGTSDPLDQIADDHGQLSVLVFELLHALERKPAPAPPVEQRWLCDRLAALREALLLHFAQEEEGLFPFVKQHFSEAAPRVAAMEAAHDGMCGSIARMVHLAAHPPEGFARHRLTIGAFMTRFVESYVSHSKLETELLQDLAGRLAPEQRAALDELIRGV